MRAKFLLLLAACAVAANIRAQMPDNGQPNYDYAFGDNVYNLPEARIAYAGDTIKANAFVVYRYEDTALARGLRLCVHKKKFQASGFFWQAKHVHPTPVVEQQRACAHVRRNGRRVCHSRRYGRHTRICRGQVEIQSNVRSLRSQRLQGGLHHRKGRVAKS